MPNGNRRAEVSIDERLTLYLSLCDVDDFFVRRECKAVPAKPTVSLENEVVGPDDEPTNGKGESKLNAGSGLEVSL